MSDPTSFLARFRTRKIAHWTLAYVAGSWLILQALDILIQNFDLPHTLFRAVLAVLAVGFGVTLLLAWYHGDKGRQRVSATELLLLAALVVLGVLAVGYVMVRAPARATPETAAATPRVDRASVAVLPFLDMSPRHDQEYFSDGLTEEILNTLAQIPGLRVAARTSSFAYKGKAVGVDSIARALHVAHVLEGSVRTEADRIRITGQLIDARTGYHLWSDAFDRNPKDVFDVQREIARAIADTLRLQLGARVEAPQEPQSAIDPQAHALVLKGVFFGRLGTREGLGEAVRLLRAAVARDPRYARAHSELGGAYQRQAYLRHGQPDRLYRQAEDEARRALALDPRDYRGHELLGRIADYRTRDYHTAEEQYRLALESNPSDATTHSHRAWMLMRLRRMDEALAEARRAAELDPISGGMTSNLAAMYLYAGRTADAADAFAAALALEPSDVTTMSNLATAQALLGRGPEAVRTAERSLAAAPNDEFVIATAAYAYAAAGRRADAERLLRGMDARPDASPYLRAGVHLALGRRERALELLQEAVRTRDDYAGDLAVDPIFRPLRDDPRFARLLAAAGLG